MRWIEKRLGAPIPGIVVAIVLIGLVWSSGCAKKTHQERVQEARNSYTTHLMPFALRQTPIMDEGAGEAETLEGMDAGMEGNGSSSGETADEEMAAEPAEPVIRTDVLLDIIVGHEGGTRRLDALTLDITQADSAENAKATWRYTVDVSDLLSSRQIAYTLEGLDYTEGDGFHVGIRQHVPAEEQGDYPEFAEAP